MIIRFTRRCFMLVVMTGTIAAMWHRTRSIGDWLRDGGPSGVLPSQPSRSAGHAARSEGIREILRERDAAAAEWFEGFREESGKFWMREYEKELTAAKVRVERETELALEAARRTNASAMREAAEVAGRLVSSQVAEAMRIAQRQIAAAERTATRQAAGNRTLDTGVAAPGPPRQLSPKRAASSSDAGHGPAP